MEEQGRGEGGRRGKGGKRMEGKMGQGMKKAK